jgi:hypothetical protein
MWKEEEEVEEEEEEKTSSSSFRITAKIVFHCALYTYSRPAVCYAKILNLEYLQGFMLCVRLITNTERICKGRRTNHIVGNDSCIVR